MSPSATATVAGRARKRGRRPPGAETLKRKRADARTRDVWIRRALYGAAVLALAFGADALYRWAQASPLFAVTRVEVSGTAHLSRSVVKARLGLREGDNLLSLDLDVLRRRIEGHPWVRAVSISRDLPGTLRIEVAERTPRAVFVPPGGRSRHLIDGEGVLLAEAGAGSERFPVLRGIGTEAGPEAWKAGSVLSGRAVETGLAALRAYRAVSSGRRGRGLRLAAVDLSALPREGTLRMDVLGPKGQATLLRLSPEALEGGLWRFFALVEHWRGKAWPGEVDLSMGNRVIVR